MTFRLMMASAGLLAATSFMAAPAMAQTTQENCQLNAAGECLQDAMPPLGPGSSQNTDEDGNNIQDLNTGAGTTTDEHDGVEQPGGGILETGPGSQQHAPDVDNNGTTEQTD